MAASIGLDLSHKSLGLTTLCGEKILFFLYGDKTRPL